MRARKAEKKAKIKGQKLCFRSVDMIYKQIWSKKSENQSQKKKSSGYRR